MQEKDIRKKLNQELDTMAPDILDKIIAEPIEPVKNEKELFGRNKPLFKEKKNIKNYLWLPVTAAAAAACIVILIIVFQTSLITNPQNEKHTNIAFQVTIDVNPSIRIDVHEDGTVSKVKAENKDGKKIVKAVNEKITEDTDYNKAVKLVVKQLNKNGYLQKKKNGMLVSVISEDKKLGREKLDEIKENTKDIEKEKNMKCTTVYQNCEISEEVSEVAEKNEVSVGKAALCIRLAEKEKKNVNKMCKKSIDTLIKKAEKSGTVILDDEIIIDNGMLIEETESETFETESLSETESIEEVSENLEETSFLEEESESEEVFMEPTKPETAETESLIRSNEK